MAGYVASKTEAIATLKCLGASTGLVFAAYLLQILALALVGIAVGLMLGGVAPLLAGPLLAGLLPASLPLGGVSGRRSASRRCAGLLATLVFALWPLAAIGRIPPGALWRDRVAPAPRASDCRWRPPRRAARRAGAGRGDRASAPDRRFALWYLGGVAAAFALFRLAALADRRRRAPRAAPVAPAAAAGARQSAPARRRRPARVVVVARASVSA